MFSFRHNGCHWPFSLEFDPQELFSSLTFSKFVSLAAKKTIYSSFRGIDHIHFISFKMLQHHPCIYNLLTWAPNLVNCVLIIWKEASLRLNQRVLCVFSLAATIVQLWRDGCQLWNPRQNLGHFSAADPRHYLTTTINFIKSKLPYLTPRHSAAASLGITYLMISMALIVKHKEA